MKKKAFILYNNSGKSDNERSLITRLHTLYMLYQLYGHFSTDFDLVLFGTEHSYDWLDSTGISDIAHIHYSVKYDDKTIFLNRLFMLADDRIQKYDSVISIDSDMKIKDFPLFTEKITEYTTNLEFLCAGRSYVNKYGFKCINASFNVFIMSGLRGRIDFSTLKKLIDDYYGLIDKFPGTNVHMHNYEENVLGRIFFDMLGGFFNVGDQFISKTLGHYTYFIPTPECKDVLVWKRKYIRENLVGNSGFYEFLDKFGARGVFNDILERVRF